MSKILRIGTRGSILALKQTEWVEHALRECWPELSIETIPITAPADAAPETPIAEMGTKGLFTKTLEDALREGRVDLVIHSLKDVASVLPDGLLLAAIPAREDVRDVLISRASSSLDRLPRGARIGTSAPRRASQLLNKRPDLAVLEIRGNVDTRLRKLEEGGYDALILAAAGLRRLGLDMPHVTYLSTEEMLPAGCQGALGLQVRADDEDTFNLAAPVGDRIATACCTAERRLQALLEGGCRVPLGALARSDGTGLELEALVISMDGQRAVRDRVRGEFAHPEEAAEHLAERLLAAGAGSIIAEAIESDAARVNRED